MNRVAMLLLVMTSVSASAQTPSSTPAPQPPPPVRSPEVHPDQRVTFRVRAPNAKDVAVTREGAPRLAMQKDDQGVWSVTTEPLEPDLYGYSFVADGARLLDSSNPLIKTNLLNPSSIVHVPGSAALPWEVGNVPHGIVHHHYYKSGVVGDQRDFFVYTPPGYDAGAAKLYPVLYLLHGMSDGADGWSSEIGRANVILDNLIAERKATPMLVVMPLGYGAPEILERGAAGRDPGIGQRNRDKFREALIAEVIPTVEKTYRAATDRQSRAIAGLSMGGAESLTTGLNSLDRFAWIGAFSSGGIPGDFAVAFPSLDSKANTRIRLLWIACGTEDGLIASNRKLREWLASKGIRHVDVETPGAHTWMVWRRNLATFVPLLFR
jgi:enterochelin esterase family protein